MRCVSDRSSALTQALEVLRARAQQQLVVHFWRADAHGDARLLVVVFDPVGQPLEVTVAVQRVTTQRAVTKHTEGYRPARCNKTHGRLASSAL